MRKAIPRLKNALRFRKRNKSIKEKRDILRIAEVTFIFGAIVLSFFSLRSSNRALKITQDQFEISNMPLLQADIDTNNINYSNDWPTEIIYKIRNIGKYPVKILKERRRVWITDTVIFSSTFPPLADTWTPDYYLMDEPLKRKATVYLNDNEIKYLDSLSASVKLIRVEDAPRSLKRRLQPFLVLQVYIEYENLSNHKRHVYQFAIHIEKKGSLMAYYTGVFTFLENSNFGKD